MENSSTTTTDPAQLPVSLSQTPTLADRMLDFLRWMVAIQTTGQLIGENEQEHPTSEFESPDSQNEQPVMMTTLSIQHSAHDSSIVTERGETIAVSIGDEDQSIDLRLTENVVPDIENQIESIAISMENPENDSSNHPPIATPIATTPHTALLHGCSDPKGVSYLLHVMYPILMGLVAGKTHISYHVTYPLTIISIVVYAMAYLNLLILSCIYDGLPGQTFSPIHYKISKYVYYTLCFLAHFLLLPLLIHP